MNKCDIIVSVSFTLAPRYSMGYIQIQMLFASGTFIDNSIKIDDPPRSDTPKIESSHVENVLINH